MLEEFYSIRSDRDFRSPGVISGSQVPSTNAGNGIEPAYYIRSMPSRQDHRVLCHPPDTGVSPATGRRPLWLSKKNRLPWRTRDRERFKASPASGTTR